MVRAYWDNLMPFQLYEEGGREVLSGDLGTLGTSLTRYSHLGGIRGNKSFNTDRFISEYFLKYRSTEHIILSTAPFIEKNIDLYHNPHLCRV